MSEKCECGDSFCTRMVGDNNGNKNYKELYLPKEGRIIKVSFPCFSRHWKGDINMQTPITRPTEMKINKMMFEGDTNV